MESNPCLNIRMLTFAQITILVSPIYRFISFLFRDFFFSPWSGRKIPNIYLEFQRMLKSQIYLAKVCYCIQIDIQTIESTWNTERNPQRKLRTTDENRHISMTMAWVMGPKMWSQRHRKQWKLDTLVLKRMKNFRASQDIIRRVKGQPRERQKLFANLRPAVGLKSRMCKGCQQSYSHVVQKSKQTFLL